MKRLAQRILALPVGAQVVAWPVSLITLFPFLLSLEAAVLIINTATKEKPKKKKGKRK